ncbi:MAG: hypothetical protein H7240_06505 [Glaciimonas sp.]|nr:hypothetical protein [Glaciimonas sp.]
MSRMGKLGKPIAILCLMCLAGCGAGVVQSSDAAQRCFENNRDCFKEVLACYRAAEASQPLVYTAKDITQLPGIQKRRFKLTSQN